MITASYFRMQAQACIQLSYVSVDEQVAAKLIAMAEEFMAKAEEMEATASSISSKPRQSPG